MKLSSVLYHFYLHFTNPSQFVNNNFKQWKNNNSYTIIKNRLGQEDSKKEQDNTKPHKRKKKQKTNIDSVGFWRKEQREGGGDIQTGKLKKCHLSPLFSWDFSLFFLSKIS